MSRNPLGPWTRHEPYLYSVPGCNNQPLANYNRTNTRTGFNSGPRPEGGYVVPTPASLKSGKILVAKPCGLRTTQYSSCQVWSVEDVEFYPRLPTWGPVVFPEMSELTNIAYSRLVQNQRASLQGLVVAAEAGKTLRGLARLVDVLRGVHNDKAKSLAADLVRLKRSSLKRLSLFVADAWLEYQFGIKPLVGDIEDLLEDIARIDSVDPTRVTGKVRQLFQPVTTSWSSYDCSAHYGISGTRKRDRTAIVKFGYTIKPEKVLSEAERQRSFGFDLSSAAVAGYELLPWSWLVDYFVNISDFLEALSFHRGILENGYKVEIKETVDTYSGNSTAKNKQSYCFRKEFVKTPCFVQRQTFEFNRTPFDLESFIPSLEFSLPGFRQTANIAAVAASRIIKVDSHLTQPEVKRIVRSARARIRIYK